MPISGDVDDAMSSDGMKGNILITGASSGIGQACAVHLGARGYRVWAGVRKPEDAERLSSRPGVLPVFVDVTVEEDVRRAASEIEAQVPEGLDAVVSNAGVAVGGPLESMPLDDVRTSLEICVIGTLRVIQRFLPLLERRKGRVINMSSMAGQAPQPFHGPYCIAKFGLEALNACLRQELAPSGIQVVSIQPGPIASGIWGKAITRGEQLRDALPQTAKQRYGDRIDTLLRALAHLEQTSPPPIHVARVVERAILASRPKPHYRVGRDAHLALFAHWLLPTRTFDRLIEGSVAKLGRPSGSSS